jgi:hypothetical protein
MSNGVLNEEIGGHFALLQLVVLGILHRENGKKFV